ncbi:unnamed protein product, partial [Amoebophrya sp. A120]|eukprot:GSA120T00001389001.1
MNMLMLIVVSETQRNTLLLWLLKQRTRGVTTIPRGREARPRTEVQQKKARNKQISKYCSVDITKLRSTTLSCLGCRIEKNDTTSCSTRARGVIVYSFQIQVTFRTRSLDGCLCRR